jgi:hypothetical protein
MILLLASLASAQDDPLADVPATPEEAWAALKDDDALTARRLASSVLRDDPDDFVANYVVAKVYWEEEVNLPRALYHYKRADKTFGARGDTFPDVLRDLHCTVLSDLAWVAEDMENSRLFFRTIERYNDGCNPDRKAEIGWRLMKDGRVDEARRVAEEGLASDDTWQVALGGNVLCALEAVVRDRAAAVEACEAVVERSRQDGFDLTVEAFNAATTTLSALDFQRTDELLELATKGRVGGSTNPWLPYTLFRLQQGKGQAAIEAMEQVQRWRKAQEPTNRARTRAEVDGVLATLLLTFGATDVGMQVIDRALLRPDRRASTTATGDTTKAAHTLIRLAMRRAHREREAERVATAGVVRRVRHWFASWLPDPAEATDLLVLKGIFTDEKLFRSTFFVYHDDGVPAPVWLLGDLIDVLGPGVVSTELDRQRTLERHPGIPAYYDALEAEAAWRRGRSDTLTLADRALAGLPEREVLLRARVAAFAGDRAWARGDGAAAMAYWERAFGMDPGVFRRLGIALPATVQAVGGATAGEAAAMVARSPRLTWDRSGFRVTVSDHEVCIATPSGNQIDCVRGPSEPTDTPAADLVDAWHTEAFALSLGLSRLDMDSLDGSTFLAEDARREALKGLLGDF